MIALTLAMNVASCDQPKAKPPSTQEIITVASLVPAATDLIDGMGARDHLIAISNWDPNRDDYASLPRVGDYRSIDWERITQLQPRVMIVQFREDKKPAGLDASAKTSFGKGVFRKCDGCGETLTAEALERNFEVCPQCGRHHKLAAAGWRGPATPARVRFDTTP